MVRQAWVLKNRTDIFIKSNKQNTMIDFILMMKYANIYNMQAIHPVFKMRDGSLVVDKLKSLNLCRAREEVVGYMMFTNGVGYNKIKTKKWKNLEELKDGSYRTKMSLFPLTFLWEDELDMYRPLEETAVELRVNSKKALAVVTNNEAAARLQLGLLKSMFNNLHIYPLRTNSKGEPDTIINYERHKNINSFVIMFDKIKCNEKTGEYKVRNNKKHNIDKSNKVTRDIIKWVNENIN